MQRAIAMLLVLAAMGLGTASAMVFGVGPMLGEPMGLTAQVFPSKGIALVAGVGYSWWQDTSTQFQGDLIFTGRNLTSNRQEEGAMAVYMGLGAQARLSGDQNTRPSGRDSGCRWEFFTCSQAIRRSGSMLKPTRDSTSGPTNTSVATPCAAYASTGVGSAGDRLPEGQFVVAPQFIG